VTVTQTLAASNLGAVHFVLADQGDRDGVLVGRDQGEETRHALEREIRRTETLSPDQPIALDFRGIRSVSVPFAEALLVPLLAGRLTGYYEMHPVVVVAASEDVSETLAAALSRHQLSVLGLVADRPDLLGGERGLRDTVRLAYELGEFSVSDLAAALDVSQQTANERLRALHRLGAVARRRSIPKGGGREFVYSIPRGAQDVIKDEEALDDEPLRT
jgi:hypothetical protein